MDEATQNNLTRRLDIALGEARVARSSLLDDVIPNLTPLRRIGAERIVRCIDRSEIIDPTLLDDIEAIASLAEREAETGTYQGWDCDDQDGHPGWLTIYRDARALALCAGVKNLRRLHAAICAALDAAEAGRLAMRISDDT